MQLFFVFFYIPHLVFPIVPCLVSLQIIVPLCCLTPFVSALWAVNECLMTYQVLNCQSVWSRRDKGLHGRSTCPRVVDVFIWSIPYIFIRFTARTQIRRTARCSPFLFLSFPEQTRQYIYTSVDALLQFPQLFTCFLILSGYVFHIVCYLVHHTHTRLVTCVCSCSLGSRTPNFLSYSYTRMGKKTSAW